MTRSSNAASELAAGLASLAAADAQRSADHSVAACAEASAKVARAMSTNATTTCASIRSSLVHGIVERLGDLLRLLPELTALMKAREDLATDCDAYSRMV